MRTRQTITISLPAEMAAKIEQRMKTAHRSLSEFAREALRLYISMGTKPEEIPHSLNGARFVAACAAVARGDFTTLDELRKQELACTDSSRN